MSIRICSLSSGSSGNCVYVSTEKASFLVDAGIPLSRVEKCLRIFGADLASTDVFITHTHSDHIKHLDKISLVCRRIYCSRSSALTVEKCVGDRLSVMEGEIAIGDVLVSGFDVSHDVPCLGYSFYHGSSKISVATDLGRVDESVFDSLLGSDLVMLESNHDPRLLSENKKYPAYLKKRILSDRGHLSNEACAEASLRLALSGTRQIILAHLSKENNTPQLAFNTVVGNLEANGMVEGQDIKVDVALQDRLTGIYEIS